MAKVLIIDDDAGLTGIFKSALENAKYEVVVAQTGEKGIASAQTEAPHLILLDYMLPDLNGVEVLKRLKSQDQTRNIPVAILTNFGQEDTIKQSLYDGASEFWLKYQLGPEDLINKVNTILLHEKQEVTGEAKQNP